MLCTIDASASHSTWACVHSGANLKFVCLVSFFPLPLSLLFSPAMKKAIQNGEKQLEDMRRKISDCKRGARDAARSSEESCAALGIKVSCGTLGWARHTST